MYCRAQESVRGVYLFYWYKSTNADEMYCRAQEIDGKRAKDKYDQVNPKFTCFTGTKVQMLTLTRLMQLLLQAAYTSSLRPLTLVA